jgi:hypothetical protein
MCVHLLFDGCILLHVVIRIVCDSQNRNEFISGIRCSILLFEFATVKQGWG